MLRKPLLIILMTLAMVLFGASSAMAAVTFSDAWYQTSDGVWHVYDKNGDTLKNCWFCDDAVASNGKDVWYLIDEHGNMVSGALVQDNTGNYYSLETSHDGYYGKLRTVAGNYNGVSLSFSQSHDGSFGAITNADGIEALKASYGLKTVSIGNSNIVYSSDIVGSRTSSKSGSTVSGPGGNSNGKNSDGSYTYNGKKYVADYSWGEHYLTGYSGGGRTRSGTTCTAHRTLSGPLALLGKVCYIKAVRGANSNVTDISRYDGIYVFEDTGGAAVETGIPSTMNTPVADIYFDTYEEAIAVSAHGWITAEVIILKEK